MNRNQILPLILGAALTLSYCKSKKDVVTKPAEGLSKQVTVASLRWPGVTEAELREGHTIYSTKCTRCHGNFEITKFSEAKWLHEIDEMAPRAQLSAHEKEKLTRHILSYRQAFASAQTK